MTSANFFYLIVRIHTMHFHWTCLSTIRAIREILPIDSDDLICHLNRFRISRGRTIVPVSRGVLYFPFFAVKFNGSVMSRHTVLCRFYTSDYYVPIRSFVRWSGISVMRSFVSDRLWQILTWFIHIFFPVLPSIPWNQMKEIWRKVWWTCGFGGWNFWW